VDCGRYASTARHAAAILLEGQVAFRRPASAPKHRMPARATRSTNPALEPLHGVVAHIDDPAHPLTADQLLTQLAWQQWRIRQAIRNRISPDENADAIPPSEKSRG
jgi:hypothetical protein